MTEKRLNPQAGGLGAGKISSVEAERELPTADAPHNSTLHLPSVAVKEECHLHVMRDGREIRLRDKPHRYHLKPTLRVEVVELSDGSIVEQTYTCDIEYWIGAFGHFIPVRPRGHGWELFDNSHDKYTVWRRHPLITEGV